MVSLDPRRVREQFQAAQWKPRSEDGPDEIWTLQQMADHLIVQMGTVRKWVVEGSGPTTFRVGKHRRVRKYAVLKWIWEQEQAE